VTLQNISTIDLAIGDDCAIHPELWFDAHMRGIMNQGVSGVAVGRLDQRLVLAPGDTVSTVVRVDQDGLQHLFSYNPKIDLTVDLILTMNPTVPQQTEQNRKPSAQPGACGFAQPSAELVIREPTPLESSDQRRAIYEGLNSNDGGEKIRTMDVLTAYIQLLGADKDPAVENVVTEMLEKLHRMDCGNKDSVLAFQQYVEALVAKGSDQTDAINAMANDDRWQTSLLALQLVHQLSDKGTAMADQLKGSKDPIVKDYATALLQSLQAVAASQPQNPAPDSQTSQTP
jgi:hypothetical protein